MNRKLAEGLKQKAHELADGNNFRKALFVDHPDTSLLQKGVFVADLEGSASIPSHLVCDRTSSQEYAVKNHCHCQGP